MSLLLLLIGLVAVSDALLLWNFVPIYFRVGIPVYRREISVEAEGRTPEIAEVIEAQLPASAWPRFAMCKLDSDEYAFRERLFAGAVTYTPIMHGTLTFDPAARLVKVTGRLNWFPIALSVYVAASYREDGGFFIILTLAIIAIIYFIQVTRFSQVVATAARLFASTSIDSNADFNSRRSPRRSTLSNNLSLDRFPTSAVAIVGVVLLVGIIFRLADSEDPYPILSAAFPAVNAISVESISPPSVEFAVASSKKSSRYRGSMKLGLSAEGLAMVPTFPSSLFRKKSVVPLSAISGCGVRNWGGGVRDALVLIGRTGTEISIENSRESNIVFSWCSKYGIPMISEQELAAWQDKGARLPQR
jgi:hypothetical protein